MWETVLYCINFNFVHLKCPFNDILNEMIVIVAFCILSFILLCWAEFKGSKYKSYKNGFNVVKSIIIGGSVTASADPHFNVVFLHGLCFHLLDKVELMHLFLTFIPMTREKV